MVIVKTREVILKPRYAPTNKEIQRRNFNEEYHYHQQHYNYRFSNYSQNQQKARHIHRQHCQHGCHLQTMVTKQSRYLNSPSICSDSILKQSQ